MSFEMYYNNIGIRLFTLIALSSVLSGLYWKHLNNASENSFLREAKSIYGLQVGFWLFFLSHIFALILPSNLLGFLAFEFLVLGVLFISMTFLLWNWVRKATFHSGVFLISLPLLLLFIMALGMN